MENILKPRDAWLKPVRHTAWMFVGLCLFYDGISGIIVLMSGGCQPSTCYWSEPW
jgi:hypothetical protein